MQSRLLPFNIFDKKVGRGLHILAAVGAVTGVTVLGVLFLLSSEAAVPRVAIETELGKRNGISVVRDNPDQVSGGVYAQFYDPASYAAGHVYGYLWADGSNLETNPFFRTTNPKIAERYYSSAEKMTLTIDGARVVKLQPYPFDDNPDDADNNLYYRLTLQGFGLVISTSSIPSPVLHGSNLTKRAFAMSVIEVEGQKRGLVIDDPSFDHVNSFKELLGQIGVRTYFATYNRSTDTYSRYTGTLDNLKKMNFFWLLVENESINTLQSWPFAVYGRVPI